MATGLTISKGSLRRGANGEAEVRTALSSSQYPLLMFGGLSPHLAEAITAIDWPITFGLERTIASEPHSAHTIEYISRGVS